MDVAKALHAGRNATPWLAAGLATAYVLVLLRLVFWHPVFVIVAGALAAGMGTWAWTNRRRPAWHPARAAAGLAIAIYLLPFARLVFWNASSGLYRAAWYAGLAHLTAMGVLFAAAPLAGGWLGARAAHRAHDALPPAATAALLALTLLAAAALWPVACDTHESWEDIPNQTCTCQGVEAEWYPPGFSDASSTDYCIGLEDAVDGGG